MRRDPCELLCKRIMRETSHQKRIDRCQTILTVPEKIAYIRIAEVLVALLLAKDEVIVHLRLVLELASEGLQKMVSIVESINNNR